MILIAIFLTVLSVLNVDGATLRRVEPQQQQGPATREFVSRFLPKRGAKYVRPSYFRAYAEKFGKEFQRCSWMERLGTPAESGEACPVRRGRSSYLCFRGEQTCQATDPILAQSSTHPTVKCICESKLLDCEQWDPCESTDTDEAPPTAPDTTPSPSGSPTSSPTSSPTASPTSAPSPGIVGDTADEPVNSLPPIVECPIDGAFVMTEEVDDFACESLNYVCIAPWVKWNIPGCGCGCEAPTLTTCPENQPNPLDPCDFAAGDTCSYGKSCCCGDCIEPTSCSCESGLILCATAFQFCEFCPAGGPCNATQGCEAGLQCVDDASDACVLGETGCDGICVPNTCPKNEDGYTYVETDFTNCDSSRLYPCADDEIRWSQDGCGCGCKKNPEVLSSGVSECPATFSDARATNLVCDIDLECEWGEESCCGVTSPSLVCSCFAGGGFDMCYHTDACYVPDCSRNCPSTVPRIGEACESDDFEGFMSFDPTSFGEPGFCGYGNFDCSCDGSISIASPQYENECRCVDDKWECLLRTCDVVCPSPPGPLAGEPGGFCGGIAAIPCGDGLSCIDDPTDSCSPVTGGADCGGLCLSSSCPMGPDVIYKGTQETCPLIRFDCEPGFEYWSEDGCGCGCKVVEDMLPPPPEDAIEVCPDPATSSCDPAINTEVCDYGTKMCPKTCGSSELVDTGSPEFQCECGSDGFWACFAKGCGACVPTCPLERPKEGDECFVLETCTFGTVCGCGDEKFEAFDCVDNKFVRAADQILCLVGCPEDDPSFPHDVEGTPCTESGGLGIDCLCDCGAPCGPEFYCECAADGIYECSRVNSLFMRPLCLCLPPPPENPDGTCPDTPPTPGEICDIPNERCGYDQVCGVNTTTYDCLERGDELEWQPPRTWIAPTCSSDPSLPVLEIQPQDDTPEFFPVGDDPVLSPILPGELPPIVLDESAQDLNSGLDGGLGIVQDAPPDDPVLGDPTDPWLEPDEKSTWPEWVNKTCDPDALEAIQAAPNVNQASCVPNGAIVTFDFRSDRVRIFYYDDPTGPNFGLVSKIPRIG